jgi:hypothetical protein
MVDSNLMMMLLLLAAGEGRVMVVCIYTMNTRRGWMAIGVGSICFSADLLLQPGMSGWFSFVFQKIPDMLYIDLIVVLFITYKSYST